MYYSVLVFWLAASICTDCLRALNGTAVYVDLFKCICDICVEWIGLQGVCVLVFGLCVQYVVCWL